MADHEAAALEYAQSVGLLAPRPIAFASHDVGFGCPVVLMSFVEGKVDILPGDLQQWLDGLAVALAAIHAHAADPLSRRYSSWVERDLLTAPTSSANPLVWRRAMDYWTRRSESADEAWPSRAVFLHRDYHPANVLWHDGAVSGVVDWVNSCRGPAGIDVGHCRMNLVQMRGVATADRFLASYQAAAPEFIYDPYWDIDTALDMCLPAPEFYAPWVFLGWVPFRKR